MIIHKPAIIKYESLPSRGAWIEMDYASDFPLSPLVAPLAGSVD